MVACLLLMFSKVLLSRLIVVYTYYLIRKYLPQMGLWDAFFQDKSVVSTITYREELLTSSSIALLL